MVRFKHRYLLLHLLFPAAVDLDALRSDIDADQPPSAESTFSPPHLSESSLISLLRDSLSVSFGDIGAGEVGGTFSSAFPSPRSASSRSGSKELQSGSVFTMRMVTLTL